MTYLKSLNEKNKRESSFFHRKKQISNLSISEWQENAKLLNQGYDFIQCLKWQGIETHKIEEALVNGQKLADVIKGSHKFYSHFAFFINIMPLQEAIEASCEIVLVVKNIQTKFVKKLSYPIFIFFFAICMILFFTNNIIPMMMQSFGEMNNFASTNLLVKCMQYFAYFIIFGLIGLLVFGLMIRFYGVTRFPFLMKLKWSSNFIRDIASYSFTAYYVQLDEKGLSANFAYDYLAKIKKPLLVQLISTYMHQSLNEGKTLIHAIENNQYFSQQFCSTYLFGIRSAQVSKLMHSYLNMCEQRWSKHLKYISIGVQSFAYSFVGLVVLLVYQMMLMPLEMLQTM